MSEIKLLPCPICSREVYIGTEDYNDNIEDVIVCDHCNLRFYGSYQATKQDLAEEWNTRKPMERIIERICNVRNNTPSTDFKNGCNASLHQIHREIDIKVKEEGGIE